MRVLLTALLGKCRQLEELTACYYARSPRFFAEFECRPWNLPFHRQMYIDEASEVMQSFSETFSNLMKVRR